MVRRAAWNTFMGLSFVQLGQGETVLRKTAKTSLLAVLCALLWALPCAGFAEQVQGDDEIPQNLVVMRVPLGDQLLILNAVAALWSRSRVYKNVQAAIDMPLENIVSPENVFTRVDPGPEERLDGVFENAGQVYRVEREDGVPVIAEQENFYIVASRHEDGAYHIDKLDFSKIER
jgi:hypothetical protein